MFIDLNVNFINRLGNDIQLNEGTLDNTLCIELEGEVLWSQGKTSEQIWQEIVQLTKVYVNGSLQDRSQIYFESDLIAVGVPNQTFTQIIGSYPASVEICFSVTELPRGLSYIDLHISNQGSNIFYYELLVIKF